jgi:hypothetical protein
VAEWAEQEGVEMSSLELTGNAAVAAELYAQGTSVNGVATKLGITWFAAKKLAPKPAKVELAPASAEPSPGVDAVWTVELTMPINRAEAIFAAFTLEEKFRAIQCVIQARMDTALE